MSASEDKMVPETIFAYRFADQEGWEVQAWECTRDQLQKEITLVGWQLEDMRVICEHKVRKGLNGYLADECAMHHHWLRGSDGNWYPMDEALPTPDGVPQYTSIEIVLKAIYDGLMDIQIKTNDKIVPISLDKLFDDQLDFVRFVNYLRDGKCPHIVFTNHDVVVLSVHPHGTPGLVRFRARWTTSNDEFTLIDVAIPTKSLVTKMRAMLRDIANHSSFGTEWLCFGELPEDLTEKLEDEARCIWEQEHGTSIDGNWPDERDFIGRYIAERVSLPEDRVGYVEKQRCAMRTLNLSELEDASPTHQQDDLPQKHSTTIQPYSEDEYWQLNSSAVGQGTFYQIAYRTAREDGWRIESFVQNISEFLEDCAREGEDVIEHRIVSEFLGRPASHGTIFFGHKGDLRKDGWAHDRYSNCWRAPGEAVARPDWSLPLHVIQEREAHLCIMEPTTAEVSLEVFSDDGKTSIFREVRRFDGAYISADVYADFNWGMADYLVEKGILADRVGTLLAIWRIEYDVDGSKIIFGEFYRHLIGGGKEWKVEDAEDPERSKPLINLCPEFGGTYACDEHGRCIGLNYKFPDVPDVALVEGDIEDGWLPLFNRAPGIPDTCELDLDWAAFHTLGEALARRLKALVGDRADIAYSKPYEDPDRDHNALRFIIPKR